MNDVGRTCETPGCNLKANLKCPTCFKLGIEDSYFCSQVRRHVRLRSCNLKKNCTRKYLYLDMERLLTNGQYNGTVSFKLGLGVDQSLIFMKLTESARRSLTEYLRIQQTSKNKPTIELTEDGGFMSFPNKDDENKFKFTLSRTELTDSQTGLFECFSYVKRVKMLQRLGPLKQKLCIQANDDIYEHTRKRITAIGEQQRARSTKKLDWVQSTTSVSSKRIIQIPKPALSATNGPSKNHHQNIVFGGGLSNINKNTEGPKNDGEIKKSSNLILMRKPLKERMIHMLAVKPHSKTDLFDAINKLCIQRYDVNKLTSTLTSIAYPQRNMYHLSKEKWVDVQDDWPFYSPEERDMVKKRKLQNSVEVEDLNSHSPRPVNGSGSSSLNFTTKSRTPNSLNSSPSSCSSLSSGSSSQSKFPTKKPTATPKSSSSLKLTKITGRRERISHYIRNDPKSNDKEIEESRKDYSEFWDSNATTNCNGVVKIESPALTKSSSSSSSKNIFEISRNKRNFDNMNDGGEESNLNDKLESNDNQNSSSEISSSSDLFEQRDNSLTEFPSIYTEFTTVTNAEQRKQYKAMFAMDFEEYKDLQNVLEASQNEFSHLGKLREEHKHNPEIHKILTAKIHEKYKNLKNDENFWLSRKRYDYLHAKLGRIKDLVEEYDNLTMSTI